MSIEAIDVPEKEQIQINRRARRARRGLVFEKKISARFARSAVDPKLSPRAELAVVQEGLDAGGQVLAHLSIQICSAAITQSMAAEIEDGGAPGQPDRCRSVHRRLVWPNLRPAEGPEF